MSELGSVASIVARNRWTVIGSTGKFKVEKIISNDGFFAVATGYWDGQDKLSVACRWHEEDGIGYPQTFGKPQWMLLPASHVAIDNALDSEASKVVLTFG